MKKIIMTIVTIIMIASFVSVAYANNNNQYVKVGIIKDFDYDNDIVIVEDYMGFLWSFYSIEDWEYNDIVGMLMHDNYTENYIFDDIIMDVYYCGHINK